MVLIKHQRQRPATATGRRGHSTSRLPAHRFDESPDDYSLASCSPAELASASPPDLQFALSRSTKPSLTFKRKCATFLVSHPWGEAHHLLMPQMHKEAQNWVRFANPIGPGTYSCSSVFIRGYLFAADAQRCTNWLRSVNRRRQRTRPNKSNRIVFLCGAPNSHTPPPRP